MRVLDEEVAQARAAFSSGDLAACGRTAHSVAGMAGNLGAAQLTDLARALERACRGEEPAAAEALRRQLGESAPKVAAEFRGWLADAGTAAAA